MAETLFNFEVESTVTAEALYVPRSVLERLAPPPEPDMTDREYLDWLMDEEEGDVAELIECLPARYKYGPETQIQSVNGSYHPGTEEV